MLYFNTVWVDQIDALNHKDGKNDGLINICVCMYVYICIPLCMWVCTCVCVCMYLSRANGLTQRVKILIFDSKKY